MTFRPVSKPPASVRYHAQKHPMQVRLIIIRAQTAPPELGMQHIASADLYSHYPNVNGALRAHSFTLHNADEVGGQAFVAPGVGIGPVCNCSAGTFSDMLLIPSLPRVPPQFRP